MSLRGCVHLFLELSQGGDTALMFAAEKGLLPIVQHLTDLGADVAAADKASVGIAVCVSA